MSEAMKATPHSVLIEQVMDSRVPKTEREHAAKREIERLRGAIQDVCAALLHRGVPTDAEHPDRIALEAARAALASVKGE